MSQKTIKLFVMLVVSLGNSDTSWAQWKFPTKLTTTPVSSSFQGVVVESLNFKTDEKKLLGGDSANNGGSIVINDQKVSLPRLNLEPFHLNGDSYQLDKPLKEQLWKLYKALEFRYFDTDFVYPFGQLNVNPEWEDIISGREYNYEYLIHASGFHESDLFKFFDEHIFGPLVEIRVVSSLKELKKKCPHAKIRNTKEPGNEFVIACTESYITWFYPGEIRRGRSYMDMSIEERAAFWIHERLHHNDKHPHEFLLELEATLVDFQQLIKKWQPGDRLSKEELLSLDLMRLRARQTHLIDKGDRGQRRAKKMSTQMNGGGAVVGGDVAKEAYLDLTSVSIMSQIALGASVSKSMIRAKSVLDQDVSVLNSVISASQIAAETELKSSILMYSKVVSGEKPSKLTRASLFQTEVGFGSEVSNSRLAQIHLGPRARISHCDILADRNGKEHEIGSDFVCERSYSNMYDRYRSDYVSIGDHTHIINSTFGFGLRLGSDVLVQNTKLSENGYVDINSNVVIENSEIVSKEGELKIYSGSKITDSKISFYKASWDTYENGIDIDRPVGLKYLLTNSHIELSRSRIVTDQEHTELYFDNVTIFSPNESHGSLRFSDPKIVCRDKTIKIDFEKQYSWQINKDCELTRR